MKFFVKLFELYYPRQLHRITDSNITVQANLNNSCQLVSNLTSNLYAYNNWYKIAIVDKDRLVYICFQFQICMQEQHLWEAEDDDTSDLYACVQLIMIDEWLSLKATCALYFIYYLCVILISFEKESACISCHHSTLICMHIKQLQRNCCFPTNHDVSVNKGGKGKETKKLRIQGKDMCCIVVGLFPMKIWWLDGVSFNFSRLMKITAELMPSFRIKDKIVRRDCMINDDVGQKKRVYKNDHIYSACLVKLGAMMIIFRKSFF